MAKSVRVYAGRDVRDLNLLAQNLRSSDITSVIAGRDILYTSSQSDIGSLLPNSNSITVAGPGALRVQAGGTIDLGSSDGILTTGRSQRHHVHVAFGHQRIAVLAQGGARASNRP